MRRRVRPAPIVERSDPSRRKRSGRRRGRRAQRADCTMPAMRRTRPAATRLSSRRTPCPRSRGSTPLPRGGVGETDRRHFVGGHPREVGEIAALGQWCCSPIGTRSRQPQAQHGRRDARVAQLFVQALGEARHERLGRCVDGEVGAGWNPTTDDTLQIHPRPRAPMPSSAASVSTATAVTFRRISRCMRFRSALRRAVPMCRSPRCSPGGRHRGLARQPAQVPSSS